MLSMQRIPDLDRIAVRALEKITEQVDCGYLVDLLADEAQGWSEKQMNIFESLSKLDRKLYCPYFNDEEDLS